MKSKLGKLLAKAKKTVDRIINGTKKAETAVETVEDVNKDIQIVATAEEDASTAVNEAEPIVKLASIIPLAPMEALRPIDKILKNAEPVFKNVLTPGVKSIASIIGSIALILVPILTLIQNRRRTSDDLGDSLSGAISVTEQIAEKYPVETKIPQSLRDLMTTVETALSGVESEMDTIFDTMGDIETALAPLDPVEDIDKILHPIVNIIAPPLRLLHTMLRKSNKTMKRLDDAARNFDKWGRHALDVIKEALNKAHIDTSFIQNIETKVDDAFKEIVNKMEQPVIKMRNTAEKKLKGLEAPLKNLVGDLKNIDAQITKQLDPVKVHLDAYVHEAAKHNIFPKM